MNNNEKRINFSLFIVSAFEKSNQLLLSKASHIQEPVLYLGELFSLFLINYLF